MEEMMDEQQDLTRGMMESLLTPAVGAVGGGGEVQLQTELEAVVECPVCYNIPRQLPIPCCPAGHIMCTRCRGRVLHCPTCRRQLSDNTSSLAASLIEKVSHKCKYWDYGCTLRDKLTDLVSHEKGCTERTVHCPEPNGCDEKVKLKEFHIHAMKNQCCVPMKKVTKFNLSKGWLQWDGMSLKKGQEFNLKEDLAWSFFHVGKYSADFFFSSQYFADEELFLFYVMVQGGFQLAKHFVASIKLINKERNIKLYFEGPVLALDSVPNDEDSLMSSPSCFSVHYRAMRNLLSVTEVNSNLTWSVDFEAEVDITQIEHQN